MTDEVTILVSVSRVVEARKAIAKLVRRAERYGAGAIEVSERAVEREEEVELCGAKYRAKRPCVAMTVSGPAPRVGEYVFLARIERTRDGNLVDARPGVESDPAWRHADGHCDHCRTTRARKHVFVVAEPGGRVVQVGRTCLRDYLGCDSPAAILARFSLLRDLGTLASDGEEGLGGLSRFEAPTLDVLSLTAVCVRRDGWLSRAAAAKLGSEISTADDVLFALGPEPGEGRAKRAWVEIHEARRSSDVAPAREVVEWVRERRESSDYMHNLRVLLAGDYLEKRRLPLACSAVAAYQRHQQTLREREIEGGEPSKHVGVVGQRLRKIPAEVVSSQFVREGDFGPVVLVKFRDDAGNLLTWFTSSGQDLGPGDRVSLSGTVREHREFRGQRETQLTRCLAQDPGAPADK